MITESPLKSQLQKIRRQNPTVCKPVAGIRTNTSLSLSLQHKTVEQQTRFHCVPVRTVEGSEPFPLSMIYSVKESTTNPPILYVLFFQLELIAHYATTIKPKESYTRKNKHCQSPRKLSAIAHPTESSCRPQAARLRGSLRKPNLPPTLLTPHPKLW